MKFLIILSLAILASSAQAAGVLICHDTYSPAQAKTTLQADIENEKQLSNIVIVPGPMLSMKVNNLKISGMQFKPVSSYGIATYVSWAEAAKYQADLPADSDYKENFSIIFNIGTKWFDDLTIHQSSLVAEILFYPDEAGGIAPFRSNMYCELH